MGVRYPEVYLGVLGTALSVEVEVVGIAVVVLVVLVVAAVEAEVVAAAAAVVIPDLEVVIAEVPGMEMVDARRSRYRCAVV